jgi:hypothetical protein
MQAVAFPSQPTKPAMSYGARDPDEIERMSHISAIGALLEEIKSRKPSRSELIQVIGTTCGALNPPLAPASRTPFWPCGTDKENLPDFR